MSGARPAEPPALRTMRGLLLAITATAMAGTAADLLLLEHYEEFWQRLPLALIAAGLLVLAFLWLASSRVAVRVTQAVMMLFIVAGLAGLFLHYDGNREFQHELDPTLAGWALFVTVVTATAPPALAPAAMIQLGGLGLLSTYRHPALQQGTVHTHPEG